MKIDEMDSFDGAQLYEKKCDNCGNAHKVYTQKDNTPEYYTAVHIVCSCGDVVKFDLPVN